ncbi:hypothetical protein BH10PAT3_BH10PAT3_8600 [soil metagenome]
MWIMYALLSALFYAVATMFSKFSVTKLVRDQKGIVVLHAAAALIFISLLWVLKGRVGLSSVHDAVMALTSGTLIGFAAIFYFKAFNMEDASVVTLLTQVTVPMTMLAGVLILHDSIGLVQLLAAGVILAGVTIATWSRKGFHLHSTSIIPVMLCATLLTTGVLIISRSVVSHNDTVAYTFYQTLGYAVFGLIFTAAHPPTRRGFIKNVRPHHPKMLIIIGIAEALYTLAILSQLKGITYVNAGLVISVGASEVFISIILGVVLTKFVPHIITEKIDKKTVGRKFVAGFMIVVGIVLLNFVS